MKQVSRLLVVLGISLALGCSRDEADPTGGGEARDSGVDVGRDSGPGGRDVGAGGDSGVTRDGGGDAGADAGDDPCRPNPCTDQAGHRTRCLWDGQGGFECHCDPGYHDSEGLCCPQFSHAVDGRCQCLEHYLHPEGDPEACVVECSEWSVEALNGYCPPGEICVQGECVQDACQGVSCPEHARCTVRSGEGVCICDEPYHMSEGLCCPPNASARDGGCRCDPGYHPGADGTCEQDAWNPCAANPCGPPLSHRNTCVPTEGEPGYTCECDQGYVPAEEGDGCILAVRQVCPDPLVCRAGFCVPEDRSREQCLTDADCREFDPTAPTTCNPEAAGGICLGCRVHSDCPGNSQCNDFGTCANLCDSDDDCPYGRCYEGLGLCGQISCESDQDCFGGTVCIDSDGDGRGQCHRIPCLETDCSEFNPNGSCPEPGQACVYGRCLSSCDPNPCTREPNRGTCEVTPDGPVCRCDPGFEEAEDGRCVPRAGQCPQGFVCESGYCVDRAAAGFQCASDQDCGHLTCSDPITLPSGKCVGCSSEQDCPNADVCLAGYCLQSCQADADCHPAMVCKQPQGICGPKDCAGQADCPAGYTCSAGGKCSRIPCGDRRGR